MARILAHPNASSINFPEHNQDRWRWMQADPELSEFIREDQEIWDAFDEEDRRHAAAEAEIDRRDRDFRRRLNTWWDSDRAREVLEPLISQWIEPDGVTFRKLPQWLDRFLPEWDGEGDEA